MTPADNPLLGTWKLISSTRTEVESGEESDSFGPHPKGFLNYSSDGRVMVVMVGDRKAPSGPVPTDAETIDGFKSSLAYAGRYTIDGNRVTHHNRGVFGPVANRRQARSYHQAGRQSADAQR